ncbi:MAG: hypothetical protein G01um101425_430 [Candidatus Peregrinibacteria bacterium Gr01-1014_25]|nr:MAG: hypothetical protein G01um101425_430 [Candidatus Peregrinibacteria bacterium Gr01-1014_25]
MWFAGYAPKDIESAIGLAFAPVGRPHYDRVRRNVDSLADRLGQDALPLPLPAKGCLVESLSAQQKRALDEALHPVYAMQTAAQQDRLRQIQIDECDEPMVPLGPHLDREKVDASFSVGHFHDACGSWAGRRRVFWVRREVAEKFAMVCRAIGDIGVHAHVEDCWRPWQVQKGLFIRRTLRIARDFPTWSWQDVKRVTSSLTAPSPGLAGHQAGAAIDWRMRTNDADRTFLDLGNEYAEGGVAAALDSPYITAVQWETRMYFLHAMRLAGFRLLFTEDWHASHGDRGMGMDRSITMRRARYGPIDRFRADDGAVTRYVSRFVEQDFLTDAQLQELIAMSREKTDKRYTHPSFQLYERFLGEEEKHKTWKI